MENLNTIIKNANNIDLLGSTVQFKLSKINGENFYIFDTSQCETPEPMVNAMIGLKNIKDSDTLIMLNHSVPIGLFPRIQKDFLYEIIEENKDNFVILFKLKADKACHTNFKNIDCPGV